MGPGRHPGCKQLRATPGSPQPPRPDAGLHSSSAVVAEEGGLRCLAGDPHEADPSNLPREAGPANGPREVSHATLGEGHGLPIVLHLFLLLLYLQTLHNISKQCAQYHFVIPYYLDYFSTYLEGIRCEV